MAGLNIPLTVPKGKRSQYLKNWRVATKKTGHLLLFAGDQKVEHLNDDFFGRGIAPDDAAPEHLFKIASLGEIGVFATQLGLIARYGASYKNIPYLVKLNGKTNIFEERDRLLSRAWLKVAQVLEFKEQSRLNIVGVGYTVYLGGEAETKMLREAATMVYEAHQAGLLAIIWIYPRSKTIKNEDDIHLIAGAAGVAATLGADFVKVKYPYKNKNIEKTTKDFKEATLAAGRTQVICVGGTKQSVSDLLKNSYLQIKNSGTAGMALGRNLHQRPLEEAVRLTHALSAIIYRGKTDKEALKIYNTPIKLKNKNSKFLNFFSF
ncbi:MAG: aldolase [Candidatus Falkowbacteria bacterium]|nr:aldolase [Candidatus Falkowbacteria bacterium]